MELRIQEALNHRRLQHEIDYLRHTQPDIYDFDRIVSASGTLQRVLNIVKLEPAAPSPQPRRGLRATRGH